MKLSIVIPSNTGGTILGSCLAAISKQTNIERGDLEVIVADNNQTEDVDTWVIEAWESLGSPFSLSVVKQPIAGAHRARMKGMEYSKGETIILCDDDNFLHPDFCAQALELMETDPDCDLLGSFGIAQFPEGFKPPDWFETMAPFYASPGIPEPAVVMKPAYVTYGAGLVIRRKVYDRLVELNYRPFLQGRMGKSLVGAEDVEMYKVARLLGFTLKRDSRLRFNHFLPEDRIQVGYAKKLSYAMGAAAASHRSYEYVADAELRPHAHRAWQHEIGLVSRRFIVSLIRLTFKRPVTNWVDRLRIRQFFSLVTKRKKFNGMVKAIEQLAVQNQKLLKNSQDRVAPVPQPQAETPSLQTTVH